MKEPKHYCMIDEDLCTGKCTPQCIVCMAYDGGEYRKDKIKIKYDE